MAAHELQLRLSDSVTKHAKSYYSASKGDNATGTIQQFDDLLKHLSDPTSAAALPVEVNLDHPISHYFISSSHNTYLTGNQLWSRSSADAYREVLERGCRCIEIDVWDSNPPSAGELGEVEDAEINKIKGFIDKKLERLHSRSNAPNAEVAPTMDGAGASRDGTESERAEPRVLHGHTATREVSFRDVCIVIRDSAFKASELPLIVSLEIHCSHAQQKIMVELMKQYWQEFLVTPPEDLDSTPLPRLSTLRRKILIKVKYTHPSKAAARDESATDGAAEDQESSDEEAPPDAVKKGGIIEELSSMGPFTRAFHYHSMSQSEAQIPTHVFALSEKKLITISEEDPEALFQHNTKYLMRAYPKGLRLNSSNLDPAPLWRFGLQMVALNFQNMNAAIMLNEAMFEGTGGWTLKPRGYYHVEDALPATLFANLKIHVKVLAGQGFGGVKDDTPRAYVKSELHVESEVEFAREKILKGAKNRGGEMKRRTSAHRSRDPDFAGEVLEFPAASNIVPALSFLRFKIMDDVPLKEDKLLGWACFRLDRLPQGLLLLKLRGPDATFTGGKLLIECHADWSR